MGIPLETAADELSLIGDVRTDREGEPENTRLNHPEELSHTDRDLTVEAVVGYFMPTARERGVDLVAEVGVDTPATMWADADKLHQVLMNLVDNALKFTPRGGRVAVGAAGTDGRVRFSVADTGPGIASQDLERIFEPFTQGRSPAGGKRRGAGLGLSIARTLVELHGGSAEVLSEEGKGATFVFLVPRDCRTRV